LPVHRAPQILPSVFRCRALGLKVGLHLFGFGRPRSERTLFPDPGFVVVAADKIFVPFGLRPGQGAALRVERRLGFPQGLETLLAIDCLAALIVVKLLKMHGFNSFD
jgi:hypothetical protein